MRLYFATFRGLTHVRIENMLSARFVLHDSSYLWGTKWPLFHFEICHSCQSKWKKMDKKLSHRRTHMTCATITQFYILPFDTQTQALTRAQTPMRRMMKLLTYGRLIKCTLCCHSIIKGEKSSKHIRQRNVSADEAKETKAEEEEEENKRYIYV